MADPFAKAEALIKKHMKINSTAFRDEFSASMLQKIARDTPVDTGRATGNWIAKGGSPNLTPQKFRDQSKGATITRQRAEKAIRKASPTQPIFISNAVQGEDDNGNFTGEGYIIGLERGKSVQSSPGMMFNKNVALSKVIASRAAKEIFK